jgi:hypothetical protein
MYERKCESLEEENLSLKLQMQALTLNPKTLNPKP